MAPQLQPPPTFSEAAASGYALERLNQTHLAMIELCLAGWTRNQIAEHLGRSKEGVGMIINSPKFQQELSRRRAEAQRVGDQVNATVRARVQAGLEDGAEAAVQRMNDLVQSSNENVALAASRGILDELHRIYGDDSSPQSQITIVNADALQVIVQAIQEDRALESGRPQPLPSHDSESEIGETDA